jgi:membrane protease YdiL (CAAX protease family)
MSALALFAAGSVNRYVTSRHELKNPPIAMQHLSPEALSDLAGNRLEQARTGDAVKRRYPQLQALPVLMGLPTESEAHAKVVEFFDQLSASDQVRMGIVARKAIFLNSINQPISNTVERFNKAQLSKQTKPGEDQVTGDDLRFVAVIESLDKLTVTTALDEDVHLVQKKLPDGWYRDAVLNRLYKNSGAADRLGELAAAQDQKINLSIHKFFAATALIILVSLICIFAGINLLSTVKIPLPESEALLASTSIKRVYGFFLTVLYAILISEIVQSTILLAVPGGKAWKNEWIYSGIDGLEGLFIVLLCTRLMICKPLGLTLKESLAKRDYGSPAVLIGWGVGLFCALRCLISFCLTTLRLTLHWELVSSNPLTNRIWDAGLHPTALNTIFIWLDIGLIGPIAEEIMFRAVLYPVLRKRLGVMRACLLNGLLFAACHLDPGGFPVTLIIGAGLAAVYERTRSLVPCVIAHMLWNSCELLSSWLLT